MPSQSIKQPPIYALSWSPWRGGKWMRSSNNPANQCIVFRTQQIFCSLIFFSFDRAVLSSCVASLSTRVMGLESPHLFQGFTNWLPYKYIASRMPSPVKLLLYIDPLAIQYMLWIRVITFLQRFLSPVKCNNPNITFSLGFWLCHSSL